MTVKELRELLAKFSDETQVAYEDEGRWISPEMLEMKRAVRAKDNFGDFDTPRLGSIEDTFEMVLIT